MAKREGGLLAPSADVAASGGQSLLTKGLQHRKAAPCVIVSTLEISLSYIYCLAFLRDTVALTSLLGSALVFFSSHPFKSAFARPQRIIPCLSTVSWAMQQCTKGTSTA